MLIKQLLECEEVRRTSPSLPDTGAGIDVNFQYVMLDGTDMCVAAHLRVQNIGLTLWHILRTGVFT